MNVNELLEFRRVLNEQSVSSGYEIEELLKVTAKQMKEAMNQYDSLLCEIEEDKENIENGSFAYGNLEYYVGVILILSADFGNVRWIRENDYNDIYDIDDAILSMGAVAFEGRVAWATIFNSIVDYMDDIEDLDFEDEAEIICSKTIEILDEYEEIEDDGFDEDDSLELMEDIQDVIQDMKSIMKTIRHDCKALRKAFKTYCN